MSIHRMEQVSCAPGIVLCLMACLSITGLHFHYDWQMLVYILLSGVVGFVLINPIAKLLESLIFEFWFGMSWNEAFVWIAAPQGSTLQRPVCGTILFIHGVCAAFSSILFWRAVLRCVLWILQKRISLNRPRIFAFLRGQTQRFRALWPTIPMLLMTGYLIFNVLIHFPCNHVERVRSPLASLYLSILLLLVKMVFSPKRVLENVFIIVIGMSLFYCVDAFNILIPYDVWLKRGQPQCGVFTGFNIPIDNGL